MSRAIAYAVNTPEYLKEALLSYDSLRRHMPEIPVAIVAPRELFDPSLDVTWVPLKGTYDSPIVKVEVYNAPFDDIVFLDSDTNVRARIDPTVRHPQ